LSLLGYLSENPDEMANARASYHAARMSLQKLLGDVRDETLFNRVTVARYAYLWTFTTPDVCEAGEVLNRWRKFTKKFPELKCFRVLEKHPKGHGWHVHFISVDRYDVREVRKFAERSGFGRIHVLRIPAEKAHYVVKYLVKALRQSTGRRLWACVGFQGVRASDILITDTFWSEVFSGYKASSLPLSHHRQRGLERIRAAMFQRDANEPKPTMEKDNKNLPLLLERLNKGEAVLLAEYRSTRVDKLSFASKQNPSQKEERVILRHGLEMGNAQVTCVEWTPQGTTPDSIRMTLKKGQLVLVALRKMITEKGQTEISGELVALS